MKHLLFSILLSVLTSGMCYSKEPVIYKSIAADGSVVFTDTPAPQATVVTPSPLNIMEPQDTDTADTLKQSDADSASSTTENNNPVTDNATAAPSVNDVIIVSPQHQQTLIDHEGPIWVGIQTAPAPSLPIGYIAEIKLDGETVASGWSSNLPIDVPERGAHVLQATVVDAEGTLQAESEQIDLFIKQRVVTNSAGQ